MYSSTYHKGKYFTGQMSHFHVLHKYFYYCLFLCVLYASNVSNVGFIINVFIHLDLGFCHIGEEQKTPKKNDKKISLSIIQIQNPFLTAQSTQIKSVISVPIKDFIHHYPRALFNDIPRVGAHFYDIPGSGRTFTTYPGRGAV